MKRSLSIFAAAALFAVAGAQAQDQTTHFTATDGTRVTVTSGQPAPDRIKGVTQGAYQELLVAMVSEWL